MHHLLLILSSLFHHHNFSIKYPVYLLTLYRHQRQNALFTLK